VDAARSDPLTPRAQAAAHAAVGTGASDACEGEENQAAGAP
jgi:hypothetical protein